MRKNYWLMIAIGLVLLISITGCGGSSGPVTVFSENFESYSVQNPWNPLYWTDDSPGPALIWDLVNDAGNIVMHHIANNGRRVYKNYVGNDYTVSAKMKVGNIGTSAGILARYTDNNHYYGLSIESGTLVLRKFPQVAAPAFDVFVFNTSTYYTLTLEVKGTLITGKVTDGVTTVSVSINDDGSYDINPYNSSGKIGVSEFVQTGTNFDDIKVTEP